MNLLKSSKDPCFPTLIKSKRHYIYRQCFFSSYTTLWLAYHVVRWTKDCVLMLHTYILSDSTCMQICCWNCKTTFVCICRHHRFLNIDFSLVYVRTLFFSKNPASINIRSDRYTHYAGKSYSDQTVQSDKNWSALVSIS